MFSSFDPHFQDFHFSGNDISAFSLLSKYTSLSLPASFSNLTLIFLYAVENSLPPCSSSTVFWSASSWMATFSTPLFPRSENLWVGLSKILKRNYYWKINILNWFQFFSFIVHHNVILIPLMHFVYVVAWLSIFLLSIMNPWWYDQHFVFPSLKCTPSPVWNPKPTQVLSPWHQLAQTFNVSASYCSLVLSMRWWFDHVLSYGSKNPFSALL